MDDELFGDKKSEFIGIRIWPALKQALSDEAKQRGQTLSDLCLSSLISVMRPSTVECLNAVRINVKRFRRGGSLNIPQ